MKGIEGIDAYSVCVHPEDNYTGTVRWTEHLVNAKDYDLNKVTCFVDPQGGEVSFSVMVLARSQVEAESLGEALIRIDRITEIATEQNEWLNHHGS
jgi:hypothetical protein